ncbi:beta-galactosidase [Wenjunlia vitaminophila]|uniref:beta-galactosidase n=1 Tax=Wenjunlia vitaminophila TaxID=76728 RepID=A0A0T6LQH5_WENVI|nr:beta-galactosidase [Wenjunlia vitaminophila]KRV48371.1 beta-galactosidase [Wenjunlia vitaminophila]
MHGTSPHPLPERPRRRAVRRLSAGLALALVATAITAAGSEAAPPAQPPAVAQHAPVFAGNDGQPHEVTWDADSLKIDDKRLNVWSGEFHYWRLPSPDQWQDVLQKMKASGFNAVSLYFFWGYHSSKPGSYDFTGVRDVDRLLTMAEQEGLYVIARPGPYINAETSMGGLPPYTTTYGGDSRTSDPQNLAADLEWLNTVNNIIARHQITDGGGSVIAYQVENEQIGNSAKQIDYIEKLQAAVRDDGITVPLFHNDYGDGHGWNVPGKPGGSKLDLYAFDTYPLGFDCKGNRGRLSNFESRIRSYSPNTPVFIAEGQGGAFTAWGRDFQTSECAKFADPAFTRQFAVNNLANGVTMFNYYMEYGGTNWGWTGDPGSGFTSYDYGAAISEDRRITPKLAVQKEFGYLQQAVTPLSSARAVTAPPVTATGGKVAIGQRLSAEDAAASSVSGHGARLITLRHADSNDTSTSEVSFPLDLGTVPGPVEGAPSYRWNDSDTDALTYTGSWQHAAGQAWTSGDHKDDETFSDQAGDSLEVTFDGPVVRWIGPDSVNHGTADVYIDGVKKATVDSYSFSVAYQQVKYEANDLGPGQHTLKIVVTGKKGDPASQGTFVSVDAIDTTPTDPPAPPPSATAYPRVPQQPGTAITLDGRDAKALVADWAFGPHRLVYSTSQVLTQLSAGSDLLVLDGTRSEDGETVLRYSSEPKVTQLDGAPVTTTWDAARGDLRLNYTHGGTATVRISGDGHDLTVLLTDRDAVATTWQLDTGADKVLVTGPDLARTARITGARLDLTGDTTDAVQVRVFAPRNITVLTWNGRNVSAQRDAAGALVASLPRPNAPATPTITSWKTAASDPERIPGFDDSGWTKADRTTADNPSHGPGTASGVVLDTDEYGFHEGDTWYRGHYTPTTASSTVTVTARTGTAGNALVWLNGTYLGAQGDGAATHTVPAGVTEPGKPAVLAVLVRNMGQYEDWSADGRSKGGRGLADVSVPGSGEVAWRIQGAAGGPNPVDPVRGLYNNGGLHGERQGWHLPGAPTAAWATTTSLKSDRPGVRWYTTSVDLNLARDTDTAVGLRIEDASGRAAKYRVQIFVNGWNTGQYVNNVGPQNEFVIPSGFLKARGTNTIALAVTAEQPGAGPDAVRLVDRGTVLGGVDGGQNPSPDYRAVHGGKAPDARD